MWQGHDGRMGQREDLIHGMKRVEDLQERWQKRRVDLERRLDESWERLKAMQTEDDNQRPKDAQTVYNEITRLDRSISFLDRALMHLDDIERGEHVAEDVPLWPGSTAKSKQTGHHGPSD
jgi:hypothetical protein